MNYVSLLGRFTRDPEVTYTQTGKAYLRFSLAVQRESNRDEVDFINCIAWEKRAETLGQYFKKGSRILISGRLSVSTYEKNGEKRTSTDVIVNNFNFIDTKSDSSNYGNSYSEEPVSRTESFSMEEDDDDFPF